MNMNDAFMQKVVAIRRKLGFSFVPTSAFRCPAHNSRVSSTGPNGPHTTGRSIDIRVNSRQRALILKEAAAAGMTRFGIGRDFIHIDDLTAADGFDEDVIWHYYPKA